MRLNHTVSLLMWLLVAAGGGTAQAQQAYFPSIGGADVRLPVAGLREVRLAGTVLQQYDFSCGSAAIATLLTHHYATPVTESQAFEAMFAQGDQDEIKRVGFSMLDMKRYLLSLGFEGDGFSQPLDKLLEARIPAIVLVNENGYQHFVVIKGLKPGRVLVGDPANGTRAMERTAFDAAWKSGLLFVIHNHTETARFNQAADWSSSPQARLSVGLQSNGLAGVTMPKGMAGDF